jgi:bifunctional non-homologous end joining protein LigD
MLASPADAPLTDPHLVYEPKYDGIRAIVEIAGAGVRIWSRLGNDKTAQFPEIATAVARWARRRREPLILDGEIVALDAKGRPAGFQQLQRINLKSRHPSRPLSAFIAFDVLRDGRTNLQDRPFVERRAALERIFRSARSPVLRLSESVRGDGRALYKRALSGGWEGLIVKHADSRYKAGRRTPDWRKLKIVHEQEFVIGGWTEPRQTRASFGALMLGVYEDGGGGSGLKAQGKADLVYVGHVGTGFDERELARLMKRLASLETDVCPFRERPPSNERPHWVKPALVAEVKFTEWTEDGRLRHPVYLGIRDDKKAQDVHREAGRLHEAARTRLERIAGSHQVRPTVSRVAPQPRADAAQPLLDQLHAIEASGRDALLVLPDGDELAVTNLSKVFWPKLKLTKGDLFRYYAQVAPFILPAVHDRPLTMKRLPNGITGQTFYQHRAPDAVPAGVRVEHVSGEDDVPTRFIGGSLKTLLYMTQLAAISQDPWFSRVQSPEEADHVALDLDPAPGVPFERVLDVARWIRDELAAIGAMGVPKTSGADGLHIYVPLPPGTPYEAGRIFCQIIATVVAHKHPQIATVERTVRDRGPRVYVDYLQNIIGKTLAAAYSARASEYAGVSTPLTWAEVDEGVGREDFTIRSVPARLRAVGDLWKSLRTSTGVDLSRITRA